MSGLDGVSDALDSELVGSLDITAVVADGGLASTPLVAAGLAAVAIAPAVLGSRRSVAPVLEPDVPAVGAPVRASSD